MAGYVCKRAAGVSTSKTLEEEDIFGVRCCSWCRESIVGPGMNLRSD
jgi:hypothetical protein